MQKPSEALFHNSESGSALAYVLGVMALLGILLSIYWNSLKFNNTLAQHEENAVHDHDVLILQLHSKIKQHILLQTNRVL